MEYLSVTPEGEVAVVGRAVIFDRSVVGNVDVWFSR